MHSGDRFSLASADAYPLTSDVADPPVAVVPPPDECPDEVESNAADPAPAEPHAPHDATSTATNHSKFAAKFITRLKKKFNGEFNGLKESASLVLRICSAPPSGGTATTPATTPADWDWDANIWMPAIYFRGQFWMVCFDDCPDRPDKVACLRIPFMIRTLSFLLQCAHKTAWSSTPRSTFNVFAVKLKWDRDSTQFATIEWEDAVLSMDDCYKRKPRKGRGKGARGARGRGRGFVLGRGHIHHMYVAVAVS